MFMHATEQPVEAQAAIIGSYVELRRASRLPDVVAAARRNSHDLSTKYSCPES